MLRSCDLCGRLSAGYFSVEVQVQDEFGDGPRSRVSNVCPDDWRQSMRGPSSGGRYRLDAHALE